MSRAPICILLATYNGESFLDEQLRSLQSQTEQNWQLLVRDDGSADATRSILNGWEKRDSRIEVVEDGMGGSGSAAQNFSRLMAAGLRTGADLFFFCDQDDVWEAQKLELMSACFAEAGREAAPRLVHSDLAVVDERGQLIHPSLIRHMALDPAPEPALNYLLTRNVVTGCAAAANRALLQRAAPVPAAAIMHDWWLALVAALSGELHFCPEALVRYRQHGGNTIGAKGFWHGLNPTRNWAAGWREGNREFLATFAQARALLESLGVHPDLPPGQREALRSYVALLQTRNPRRWLTARRLGLRQGNYLLQLIFYLRLALIRDDAPNPDLSARHSSRDDQA